MLKNGLSAPYHLNEIVDFDQTSMESSTGDGADLITLYILVTSTVL